MLFFIYMTVLMYGITVMRGVMEEKQSRIVEVIASSVKPTQMMLGKLVGIGLVGLTQYGIWVGSAAALTAAGASMVSRQGFKMPTIPFSLLLYFVAFFILGYFLYATLYAMVGAICATEEEAQQAQMPVTMIIIVPMLLFPMVMNNPSSGVSMALSLVPFFAPTLMMMRIGLVNPPVWQVLLSMALMVATILIAVWVAARIYRVGILMYGKRPSIAELGRWLRYT
jgi:ABC-2 type transport system permease protein